MKRQFKSLRFILGDQLNAQHSWFDSVDNSVLYIIAELHQETDFVARYGGEEFVIILKNTDQGEAHSVAQNLLQSIANLKIHHEKSPISDIVTISIGIYSFKIPAHKRHQQSTMFYFEKADKALYSAKKEGRNRAVHYVG